MPRETPLTLLLADIEVCVPQRSGRGACANWAGFPSSQEHFAKLRFSRAAEPHDPRTFYGPRPALSTTMLQERLAQAAREVVTPRNPVEARPAERAADAPPYTIVGGNPAKPIKQRFEPDVMARLNEVVWCDWPIEKVSEHLEQFVSGDIEALRARAANA